MIAKFCEVVGWLQEKSKQLEFNYDIHYERLILLKIKHSLFTLVNVKNCHVKVLYYVMIKKLKYSFTLNNLDTWMITCMSERRVNA